MNHGPVLDDERTIATYGSLAPADDGVVTFLASAKLPQGAYALGADDGTRVAVRVVAAFPYGNEYLVVARVAG